MAPRDPALFHTETINGKRVTLIGATQLLEGYFTGLTVDATAAVTTRTESVNATTVKRWPGDPGYSRASHSRVKSNEKTKGGPALPGRRFWCERATGTGDQRRSNARQFNYIGDWMDLVALARASSFGDPFVLRNSSGRSVLIAD